MFLEDYGIVYPSKTMLNTTSVSPTVIFQDGGVIDREHRRKRLKNIIISRLKDTRDVLETREALSRPWKTGGMEFQPDQVERVMKEIELAKQALAEELKLLRTEQSSAATEQSERLFETTFEKHMEELAEPELSAAGKEELLDMEHGTWNMEHGKAQTIRGEMQPGDRIQENSVPQKIGLNVKEQVAQDTSSMVREGKPRVDSVVTTQSVTPKPRLVGPIDELANMTIEDFRRLGTPVEAAKKIVEKVDLLAADSLLEQKKAIDAWKRSEMYKTYLGIGTESLEKKISVSEVIENRQKRGLVTLTSEEFNQVAEVNRKISFSR